MILLNIILPTFIPEDFVVCCGQCRCFHSLSLTGYKLLASHSRPVQIWSNSSSNAKNVIRVRLTRARSKKGRGLHIRLDECRGWTAEKASLWDTYRLPTVSRWRKGGGCEEEEKQWYWVAPPPPSPNPTSPHTPQALPSLKWIILVMLVTGRGLDFDLCSSKPKIKESI